MKSGCLLVGLLLLSGSGCAVHYHDRSSGKTHVLGIGLVTYNTSVSEGRVAVITQDRTLGLGAGNSEQSLWAVVGYDNRTQVQVLDTDNCLRLEWPSASLVNVRVGSRTPRDWSVSDEEPDMKTEQGIECPLRTLAK